MASFLISLWLCPLLSLLLIAVSLTRGVKVQVKFHETRTNGTVYIKRNGITLPLCEDNWDITKSRLACKSEGYPDGNVGPALETTAYQSHNASFWKVKFKCNGKEKGLHKCNVTVLHTTASCKNFATVSCKVRIRLWPQGKKDYHSGLVQVFFRDKWWSICRDMWSMMEATVVCKSEFNETAVLDFDPYVNMNRSIGGHTKALFSDLFCRGSENSLMDCQFSTFPVSRCRSTVWASLVCKPKNVLSLKTVIWHDGSFVALHCKIKETVQEWTFRGSNISQSGDLKIQGNILIVRNVRPEFGGIYMCRGTTESEMYRVIVVSENLAKQKLVYGKKGEVVCKFDAFHKHSYSWSYDSSFFPPENVPYDNGDGILTFDKVVPEHAGAYDCIIGTSVREENFGKSSEVRMIIMVSVYAPLNFTKRPPSSLTVYQGNTEYLNCSAFSWPITPTITWILKGKEIFRRNTTTASLKITVDVEQGTEYTCVAKSTKSEIKAKTTLLVHPVIKNTFSDTQRFLGKSYQYFCDAIGNPPPSVLWTRNNTTNVSSDHLKMEGKVLFFQKLNVQDSGQYKCIASNFVGSTWKSLRLEVLQPDSDKPGIAGSTTSSDARWYVIGGSIGGFAVLILLIPVVYWIRKLTIKSGYITSAADESVNDPWQFPRTQLTVLAAVGKGAFGEVYKAIARGLEDGKEELIVAVKEAKEDDFVARESLKQEIKQGKALGFERHPNICNFLGCITVSEPITVIYEFAEHGDLLDFLHKCIGEYEQKSKGKPSDEPLKVLASYDLTKFCIQIASGMSYLHSKGVIHRDLAARNILVAEGYVCKITDFGLALERGHYGYAKEAKKGQLPVKWSAPELLFETKYPVTAKIDVWSYGILMYEVFTIGESPYPKWPVYQVLCELQQNNYRMAKPDHVSDFIYGMMSQCWQNNPEDRPSFEKIHRNLVESQSEEYLDMSNVVTCEYQPKSEPSVDGEREVNSNKPEFTVASDDKTLVNTDSARPTTEDSGDDNVTCALGKSKGKPTALLSNIKNDEDNLAEDMIEMPSFQTGRNSSSYSPDISV